jgi:flagellin
MALSVLNNIPSLVAQDNLGVTNANLQNTLFQLSSGSRINSGADDPAGLSIANGLQANIGALQQSSQNATLGVGQLQVADGALSQVTTLLNRAVTLATEAANGGLTPDQYSAITNEYSSITSEINRIGQATTFNGSPVFQSANGPNPNQLVTMATSSLNPNTALTAGTTTSVQLGNGTAYTYKAGTSASILLGSAGSLTQNSTIATGKTMTITNSTGTVNFTANPMTSTGNAGGLAQGTATNGGEQLQVTNASGTTTYVLAGVSTVGAWLSGFNTAGAAKGVSAYLSGGNIVVQSNSGITAVTPNAAFTTLFGTMANEPLNYIGGTPTTSATAATATNESLSVTNGTGTATYAGGAATIGAWIIAFNTAAAGKNVSAALNSAGYLEITSTNPITAVTQGAGNKTDFGTLVAASDTVGDLMNQINTSSDGLTASINSSGQFQVTSSNGAVSIGTNNSTVSTLGTVTATNTIQDLIGGINGSGLGVTASLQSVQNLNQLVGSVAPTGGASATLTGNLVLNSGTEVNGSYPNSFTYSANPGTPDPVAGTPGNNTVQGLIDAINNSGTPFRAFLDNNGNVNIIDTSYSNNVSASSSSTLALAGPTALTFANPLATTQLEITDPQARGDIAATNNDPLLGFVAVNSSGNPLEGSNSNSFTAPELLGPGGADVYISDGVTDQSYNRVQVPIGPLNTSMIGSNTTGLASVNLGTSTTAAEGLVTINGAISSVAAMRGVVGAGINRLTSATTVVNTQIQNLTSAQSSIQDANIGQVVANLSKYQVLEQTGIASLAQANTQEQAILRLLP